MAVTVREKPKGSGEWWIFINHQGKRKSKKIGKDKKLACKVAEKIKARLVLNELRVEKINKKCPTFKQYVEIWLEDYIGQTKRVTTYQRYKAMFQNHIESSLGKLPMDQIKRCDIRNALLSIYKKGLSKSTISTARNVISGAFEYAIDEELVNYNPTIGILKKLGLDPRKERNPVQPMNPEEVFLFLETCRKFQKKWYPFYLCAFRTGMRLGELLALEWGDIDWNGKFIHVQRSFRNGRTTRTKNKKSRRVDMSNQLYTELRALYTVRKKESLKSGKGMIEVIFHTSGEPTSQNTIRNIWKRILKKAGLRNMRFHDIRHTFSSLLLSKGESPVYVKEQLGHSSIQMTVDIYGHLIPSGNRDAVNSLDDPTPICTLSAPCENEKAATY